MDGTGRRLMMGNEAIARGALEAGIDVLAAYPGTPSSEIGEFLAEWASEHKFYAEWSVNEKVSFDVAVGAATVGARAIVPLKNAGFNWIMDMYMTVPYGGVKGGLVVAVADDPGAHYSSNEQDTRILAKYAELLCMEPSDQQDAKDYTKWAFEASEKLQLPVVVRSVTRISHASGDVKVGNIEKRPSMIGFNKHYKMPYRWNVYGPPGTVEKHKWQKERYGEEKALADECIFNVLTLGRAVNEEKKPIGIIASGIGYSYALEALSALGIDVSSVNMLKLATPHPLPSNKVGEMLARSSKLIVIEEGEPFVEGQVREFAQMRNIKIKIVGKMSNEKVNSVFPKWGELDTDVVIDGIRRALPRKTLRELPGAEREKSSSEYAKARAFLEKLVTPRSSTLCAGCPHLGSYWALKRALEANKRTTGKTWVINGDIGCYEQGGYGLFSQKIDGNAENAKYYAIKSPYETLDTNYIMGGGIGLAQGQNRAGLDANIVAVAGDSTFFHACLPSLVSAVQNKTKVLFLVMDNRWTCMTGHQPSPTTGKTAMGDAAPVLSIEEVCKAMKVPKLYVADAYDIEGLKNAIGSALDFGAGPSVVVVMRECMLQVLRREKRKCYTRINENCNGCKTCISLGCPAVVYDAANKKAMIENAQCVNCGICRQICERGAIVEDGGRK